MRADSFRKKLDVILNREGFPDSGDLNVTLENCRKAMNNEDPAIRPPDREGRPGGLVILKDNPVILVPDLHARIGFLAILLNWNPPGFSCTVLELLEKGEIQLVCLGDGFHSESRGRYRWHLAWEEFQGGFAERKAMDEEMSEGLGVMQIVMGLKTAFPESFHFLKGNHENVANESIGGNRPFIKMVDEGAMVALWFRKSYPEETFRKYYNFEKSLPVFARGTRFCAVHAEPARYHSIDRIINARFHPGVIFDLTWTGNGEARKGSVASYLDEFFPGDPDTLIYGGHRPVTGLFNLRAEGRYIQFHNPDRYLVAIPGPALVGVGPEYGIMEIA